jgi:ribose transport system ATP-binding protein
LRAAAGEGTPVVVASSDYEPLAMVSDRVLVFAYGRVIAELTGDQITKESITSTCLLGSRADVTSPTTTEVLA